MWKVIQIRESLFYMYILFSCEKQLSDETECFTPGCVSGVVVQEDRSGAVCMGMCWDAPAGI